MRLRDVRCFEDVEVPLHPRVTVVIGENGAGKTTIAEAMASLSGGEREGLAAFPLRRGAGDGRIELYEAGSADPVAWWTPKDRRRLPETTYLFAYGRYRRVQPTEERAVIPRGPELFGPEWAEAGEEAFRGSMESNLSESVFGRRTTTLFSSDHYLLRDLGRQLVGLNRLRSGRPEVEEAWRALGESVRALGCGLEGIDVVEREGRDFAVVRRSGLDLDLRELSDGYQAILVVVIDLLIRRAFLPSVEVGAPAAMTVIIDEVDLHLHPRWQRSVIRQLTGLFPEIQLVITTHSPAVVQGAIDDGYAVLVLREDEGRVAVTEVSEKQRRALRGAQLGSVLVDEHLFGVTSRYSPRYEAVERRARTLRRKLEKGTATPEDRRELIAKLDKLEELMADEEERWAKQPLMRELAKAQIASLKELAAMNEEGRRGSA